MSFNPDFVQLRFIYERDKYLLKEVVQEMGLKMAAEVTHVFMDEAFKCTT